MKKTTKELRQKAKEDLKKEVEALNEEIAKMNLEQKVNPAKDSNLIFKKRKRLAAVLTVLSEKTE